MEHGRRKVAFGIGVKRGALLGESIPAGCRAIHPRRQIMQINLRASGKVLLRQNAVQQGPLTGTLRCRRRLAPGYVDAGCLNRAEESFNRSFDGGGHAGKIVGQQHAR